MGEHKLPKTNGQHPPEREPGELLLRQMNHREWLSQFSEVLSVTPRERSAIPMTPFRAGAITRLKMAAEYIRVLQLDVKDLQDALAATNRDLTRALAALDAHKRDEAFDNPHHGHHDEEDGR